MTAAMSAVSFNLPNQLLKRSWSCSGSPSIAQITESGRSLQYADTRSASFLPASWSKSRSAMPVIIGFMA